LGASSRGPCVTVSAGDRRAWRSKETYMKTWTNISQLAALVVACISAIGPVTQAYAKGGIKAVGPGPRPVG